MTSPMPSRPRVIVTGYNIRYPLGGMVAEKLHYLVGLIRLGCDVWYVEESGSWPNSCYNPVRNENSSSPGYGIAFLKKLLAEIGIENHWVYVDEQRRYHNLSASETLDLCRKADLLLTISSVTWLPESLQCRRRAYVHPNPGLPQFQMPTERHPPMSG